ncbi:hypothetical protein WJX84_004648 [Apatococcus fuscideae]|uniref:Uncharacterized protein n=1 Tax=Apatococcus fuscideae TaxID=2026836 RepID=A0AAW1SY90_9CHLO
MSGGKSASRRSGRDKKTAQKVAVVGKAERQQAATARLDRLEDDQDAAEILGQQSDDEFRLEDSDEGPQLVRGGSAEGSIAAWSKAKNPRAAG